MGKKVTVVKNILDANDRLAASNRELFAEKNVFVVNLMSSPGAGKTTLLENTISALKDTWRIGVIEGDIQDTYDADRIAALNIPVVQINTGGACHIDGNMIQEAIPGLDLDRLDILFVENVGNLVCPAEFDIGEHMKAMVLSTPEGADKPAKYPLMFQASAAMVINKIDLLPYVNFDMDKAERDARIINPKIHVFRVSCRTGEGIDAWGRWLTDQAALAKAK